MVVCHRQPVYENRQTVHGRRQGQQQLNCRWHQQRIHVMEVMQVNLAAQPAHCYIHPAQGPFMEKDSIRQVNLAAMRLGSATITHRPGL